ncbi:hypothetical protein OIU74_011897 [Salix koriyanagi]|uniref:Uncharacterized protein n=1 Tax=Salix koriyanagi TaxID=2511006 RepID=A0A9Q0TGH6_9ROSI|nr:hypothetical protein OIU74_011897 [Salix koriyanagi]
MPARQLHDIVSNSRTKNTAKVPPNSPASNICLPHIISNIDLLKSRRGSCDFFTTATLSLTFPSTLHDIIRFKMDDLTGLLNVL